MVDAHVDEFRTARHDRVRAVVLELVADIDDDVDAGRIGQRVEVAAREITDPERMAFREVGVELAYLRDRHAEQLGELHRLGGGLRLVDLVAHHHQRHPGLDQEPGGALHVVRVGPHPHARIELILRDDLGLHPLVVEVGMPRDVGGPVGRGPRCLEGAPHGFRDHVAPAREPGVFGDRLDHLLLVEHLLEAVAPGAPRLVGAVGVEDERGLLLVGVEHLADGVGHADHRGLHHDRGLAGGLDVARRHRGAGTLVRRQDVFELRAIDERLVELRVLARRIAEHILHARRDQLLGEGGAAVALKSLHRSGRRWGGLRQRDRTHRAQHRLGGRHGQARLGQAGHEIAARYALRQIFHHQVSHARLPGLVLCCLVPQVSQSAALSALARNWCRDIRPLA